MALDPLVITRQQAAGIDAVAQSLDWAESHLQKQVNQDDVPPILIYATADPTTVKAVQAQLGVAQAGELMEHTLSQIAVGLSQWGVGQLVVAGGETSGACVQALGITQMQIGPQIDPGVPWCFANAKGANLHLALKSGNFGTVDFFSKALGVLE